MDFFRAFKTPSKFAQEFLFFSDGLGHFKSKDFMVDRDSFNNNLIVFVISGKLHVEQNGHHVIKQNQGIIMRLSDKHKYYTDDTNICEILCMHFSGRQSEIFLKFIEQTYTLPALFKEDRVCELIKHCFTLYKEPQSENEFLISELIYSIVLTILHALSKENKKLNMNTQTEFINKAICYIDNNIYNKITLLEFAQQFSMSAYHFCRVFESYFHVTPIKYIRIKKIEISKYMLTYTLDSISDIACSLGFVDQSHFSRTFKTIQKQTPSAFRKSYNS